LSANEAIKLVCAKALAWSNGATLQDVQQIKAAVAIVRRMPREAKALREWVADLQIEMNRRALSRRKAKR
jgi:hypothetical protein